jgi:hypothetical protein
MESPHRPTTAHATYRMSWTAYVPHVLVFFMLMPVGILLFRVSVWLAAAVIVLALGLFSYKLLSIRSLLLYTDDHGVWVYRGILPWARGTTGVKWRDLEDAVYYPNFLSWLLRSYTIRVGHRFTKTSEIVLPHIARGHEAVVHINERHRQLLASGSLEQSS